jgi:hypothetical protein
MRIIVSALAVAVTMVATDASAQVSGVSLSGQYRCVAQCPARVRAAAITQYGWDFNAVNNIGQASRGWVDWPGHIWIRQLNQGAIYSPTGTTIQFDNGTVWRRHR